MRQPLAIHLKHYCAIVLYCLLLIGFARLASLKTPLTHADTTNPTGRFYIVGTQIIDPNGHIFLPIGANVGMHPNNFDWAGTALGHSAQAQAWGWNTIRLNFECTTAESFSNVTPAKGDTFLLQNVDQVVQEYTAKHIVVILECHDAQKLPTDSAKFWVDAATKYKNNPYVWFNYANEPDADNQTQWVADQTAWLRLIRGTGAENIFVADVLNSGNDAGWNGVQKVYTPSVGPAVANGQCNVLFSMHNYGGLANATDGVMRPQVFENYWQQVQQAGLAMIIGEYGLDYRLAFQTQADGSVKVVAADGTSDPAAIEGIYHHFSSGEYATTRYANHYGIGFLAWHATFADSNRLATPIGGITLPDGTASGNPNFYNILNAQANGLQPGFSFTQLGLDLWNAGHNQPNLGNFSGNYAASHCSSAIAATNPQSNTTTTTSANNKAAGNSGSSGANDRNGSPNTSNTGPAMAASNVQNPAASQPYKLFKVAGRSITAATVGKIGSSLAAILLLTVLILYVRGVLLPHHGGHAVDNTLISTSQSTVHSSYNPGQVISPTKENNRTFRD